jgi:hypothetical protein
MIKRLSGYLAATDVAKSSIWKVPTIRMSYCSLAAMSSSPLCHLALSEPSSIVWVSTPSSWRALSMPRCAESAKDLSPSTPFSTRITRSLAGWGLAAPGSPPQPISPPKTSSVRKAHFKE